MVPQPPSKSEEGQIFEICAGCPDERMRACFECGAMVAD